MRSVEQIQPPAGEPTGHSAQYQTIARALGNALGAMENTIDEYSKTPGWTEVNVGIQLEAHCVTITLLSAALCESVANTVLATFLSPSAFAKAECCPTVEKWTKRIPEAIGHLNTIPAGTIADLKMLVKARNAVVHPKAQILGADTADGSPEILHEGTPEEWAVLNPAAARRFAALCIELAGYLPDEVDAKVLRISRNVQDHWLLKALERGARRQVASPVTPPQNNSANSKPT
ncbi:MAG: hypothetical protein QM691_16655 [Opitutaceae bacterium]